MRPFRLSCTLLVLGLALATLATSANAQPGPPQQTKEQIKAQIKQLQAESRVLGLMIDADGKNIYINSDTAMRRLTDASLGPIFGREEDYSALADKVNAAAMACQEGMLTSFCGPQLKGVYDDARKLLERPVFLLTGEVLLLPDPAEVLDDPQKAIGDLKQLVSQVMDESGKVISDLKAGGEAGSLVGELMNDQESLLQQKFRIDTQIDSLFQTLGTTNGGADDTGNSQRAVDGQGRDISDLNGVGPENLGALNSPNGILIDSQLVSDSSAPSNGIAIDTQFLSNSPNEQGVYADGAVQISSELVDDQPSTGASAVDGSPLTQPATASPTSGGFWQNLAQIGLFALQGYQAYNAAAHPAFAPASAQKRTTQSSAAKPKPWCTGPPEQCAAMQLAKDLCLINKDCSKYPWLANVPPPPPPPPSAPGQGCNIQWVMDGNTLVAVGNAFSSACPTP
jgi:hypothetical protein